MALLDENASILQRLAERGDDMRRARPVDFVHIFTDKSSAERFADYARQAGFRVDVVATEDGSPGMLNRIEVIAPPNSAPQ